MPMDNDASLVIVEAILYRSWIDIHNLRGFLCHRIDAMAAHLRRQLLTFQQWLCQEPGLPLRCPYHRAKGLVVVIVGTKGIAMNQYYPGFIKLQQMWLIEQGYFGRISEGFAEQKIPVPGHEKYISISPQLSQ